MVVQRLEQHSNGDLLLLGSSPLPTWLVSLLNHYYIYFCMPAEKRGDAGFCLSARNPPLGRK